MTPEYKTHRCVQCSFKGIEYWHTSKRERQIHRKKIHGMSAGTNNIGSKGTKPVHFKKYGRGMGI